MLRETMPVWAEVDLDNLAHNIREVRRITRPETIIMAVVKADAYGHGATTAAKTFLENGADRLAVATPREALELRRAGYDVPILVLGYTPAQQSREVVEHDVTPTVYTYGHAEALSRAATAQGRVAKIHVKLETGMGRLGFLPTEKSIDDIVEISRLPSLEMEGVFTHFAVADTRDKRYTREQFGRYLGMAEALEERGVSIPLKHVSNSAAIIDLPGYNLDMVRPGSIIYGIYPSEEVDRGRLELRPAMTLKARVSNIKTVPAGTGISYGLTFATDKASRIGTLSVGYADGYSRLLSNRAEVGVKGRRAPVVGRVCMDQCMVDLT
ncbi:MAG: alanine racemase, partial [Candidatus Bathyarchaeota archaeon]|nr:alanine racemase [Candidatus Bathyarchaeota archaeon]